MILPFALLQLILVGSDRTSELKSLYPCSAITGAEWKAFDKYNEIRSQYNLPSVAFGHAAFIIAKLHVTASNSSYNSDIRCSSEELHSWYKGPKSQYYTACCYADGQECGQDKAKDIFQDDSWDITVEVAAITTNGWSDQPEKFVTNFQGSKGHWDEMVNHGTWATYSWATSAVAFGDEYGTLTFMSADDPKATSFGNCTR